MGTVAASMEHQRRLDHMVDHHRSLPSPKSFQHYNHESRINCVVASRPFLFTGSEDGSVEQWNVDSGRPLRTFKGHKQPVYGLCCSGDQLFSASGDLTACSWEVKQNVLPSLWERTMTIHGVDYPESPSKPAGYQSPSKALRLSEEHDETGSRVVYKGHTFGVYCVQEYQGSLYTGSLDETVRQFNIETGDLLHTFEIETMIQSFDFQGDYFFTGSTGDSEPAVQMWSLKTKECVHRFVAEQRSGDILAVAVEGNWLFSTSGFPDSCVKMWNITTGELEQNIGIPYVPERIHTIRHGHTKPIRAIIVAPGAEAVITCSEDHTVKQWDVQTGKCLRTFEGHDNEVRDICMDETGQIYTAGSDKISYQLWAYNNSMHRHAMSPLKNPDKSAHFDPMLEHTQPAAGAGSPVPFASSSIHSPAGRGHGRATAPPMATAPRQVSADEEPWMPEIADLSSQMIEDYLKQMFTIGDTNGDGVLSPDEFAKLLSLSGFNFSKEAIDVMVKAADVNGDGVINFEEFVPAIMGLSIQEVEDAAAQTAGNAKEANNTQLAHPSSYTAEDLEQYFEGLFSIADADGDGVLQPDELEQLLGLCGFDLSAEEIAQFVSEADTNQDGVIEYDEFVPVATKMLQGLKPAASEPKAAPVPAIDTTTNQQAAEGEAWESPREYANDYWKSPTCPFDVSDLLGDEAPKAAPKLEIASSTDLEYYFKNLFKIADVNGDGVLSPEELKTLLSQSGLKLSPLTIDVMVDAADVNGDGLIDYDEFVPLITSTALAPGR